MNIPQQIVLWAVNKLVAYANNARTHSPEQVAQVAASMSEFGWTNPILIDGEGGVIAGHARLEAARKLGLTEVPCIVLDHLTPAQKRALVLADNKLALNAGWNEQMLRQELAALTVADFKLDLIGFSDDEIAALLAPAAQVPEAQCEGAAEEQIPEAPAQPVTKPGDVWRIAGHRLICGDCRDLDAVRRVLNPALSDAHQVAIAITSPPYATQRSYDPTSGFKPIPPDEYGAWYRSVAHNIGAILADDGSYLLNIKEHAEDGERSLYVKDLVLAHRREWGWLFVDEFCWRKTDNGVPGGWGNHTGELHEISISRKQYSSMHDAVPQCREAVQLFVFAVA